MTTEEKKTARRVSKRAALIGFALALACNLLPEQYRTPCEMIVNVCVGGF